MGPQIEHSAGGWSTQPTDRHIHHAGAFTPGCSVRHLPAYLENLPKIKEKGVDVVAVVAFNDAWVMSAWGKANGVTGDDIVRGKPLPPFPCEIRAAGGQGSGRQGSCDV